MDAGRHSPNCRIRTEPFLSDTLLAFLSHLPSHSIPPTCAPSRMDVYIYTLGHRPHTNGLDYRRVSLTKPNSLGRSNSARFTRHGNTPFTSVIGDINPRTRPSLLDLDIRGMKRSKSDRFKFARPQWKPPGSPNSQTSNQSAQEKFFSKPSTRSRTLPRLTKKTNLLVSFDLNASHDFGETNSVVSCPSLRSAIRNPSKSLKPNSFAGLAITDSRKSLRTLKGSWCDQLNHIPRSRTLSPERLAGSRLRSRSAGPGSRQQPSSPLSETSTSTVRPSQLSSAYSRTESPDRSSESTHSLLHSYLPKCLSADIVIECAQDRLVELQNQVVEAYRARAEVTQALDDQRSQLDAMNDQLFKEYERTKNLLFQLKRLSLRMTQSPVAKLSTSSGTNIHAHPGQCSAPNVKLPGKHSLDAIEEHEAETPPESAPPSSPVSELPTQIEVKVTSPDYVNCQIERLRVSSAHQRQCDQLLCKMVVCRESLKHKVSHLSDTRELCVPVVWTNVQFNLLEELQKQRSQFDQMNPDLSEKKEDIFESKTNDKYLEASSVLELVQNFQRGLVEYEKGCIRQSSVEISVLQAEISHLSNGPMKEARNALEKLLRIHQLKQMEFKAKSLCYEQTKLIRNKYQELANVINEVLTPSLCPHSATNWRVCKVFHILVHWIINLCDTFHRSFPSNQFNFVSQMWASERDLKLYANQQLSERLALLTGHQADTPQKDTLIKAQLAWKKRQDLTDSGSYESKMDHAPTVFSLFGALCKEIRRLQTRSAKLIDALNTLNSGKCNAAQLVQIRLLVHQSGQSTSLFWRCLFSQSNSRKTPMRRDQRKRKFQVEHARNGFSPVHSGASNSCFDLSTHSTNNPFQLPNDDRSFPTTKVDPTSVSQAGLKSRRRRPVSFYLKRSFEPVLEDIINEADEEVAESP
ncbi:hypothetical protein FBUS_05345 [Fasciolopsis buskii]|uniref:Uncharacterized protein n=1 Tax=Fasciolopsis buskii TaxID=27845 RepID=A0A8E0VL68_9TREM|nr:hypothetical protein FBUS_05345 [Fasciolopsis buski]